MEFLTLQITKFYSQYGRLITWKFINQIAQLYFLINIHWTYKFHKQALQIYTNGAILAVFIAECKIFRLNSLLGVMLSVY